jgi:hypothetical protein
MTMHGATLSPHHRVNIAAAMLRISPEEYADHLMAGEKRCSRCKAWHKRVAFGPRSTTSDGLNNVCRAADNDRVKAYHRRRREVTEAAS